MIFETIESPGLAQRSYVVGDDDEGVCAVIDPRRDVDVYLQIARDHQARITSVLETHIHADFVSGSAELARRTGAPLHTGSSDRYTFDRSPLEQGEVVRVGRRRLRALHTPGHSPEHLCFALSDGADEDPWCIFTGDTLFAGSVGRPDLSTEAEDEELAKALHRSLTEHLFPLGDHVVVFPGHGSGSPCGSSIGGRDLTTLGQERRSNDALQGGEEAFVRQVLADLPEEPLYYPRMKEVNAGGPAGAEEPPHPPVLSSGAFRDAFREEATVLVDTREIVSFAGAHIPGALNIPLRRRFPIWAGWMLNPDREILLVVEEPRHVESIRRHLFRIGLDRVRGYLRGGMRQWIEAGSSVSTRRDLSVHQLAELVLGSGDGRLQLLDVRSEAEWRSGHIPGARHVHAPFVDEVVDELDRDRPIATYCGTGYRAGIAASVLERHGFAEVRNVPGSMTAWRAAGYPTEDGGDDGRE